MRYARMRIVVARRSIPDTRLLVWTFAGSGSAVRAITNMTAKAKQAVRARNLKIVVRAKAFTSIHIIAPHGDMRKK